MTENIHVIARAFRPAHENPDKWEALFIAFRGGESGYELVWHLASYIDESCTSLRPNRRDWQADLTKITLDTYSDREQPKADEPLGSSWERIELFRKGGPQDGDLLAPIPRLSLDLVSNSDVPETGDFKYANWIETGGYPNTQNAFPTGPVSILSDRSCLYWQDGNQHGYLIANCRLRNIVSTLVPNWTMTWQIALCVSKNGIVMPSLTWDEATGDLLLRDLMNRVRRGKANPEQAASFSLQVLKTNYPVSIDSLCQMDSQLPQKNGTKSLSYRNGMTRDNDLLTSILSSELPKIVKVAVPSGDIHGDIQGGIAFLEEKDIHRTVRLRFYSRNQRLTPLPEDLGQFAIEDPDTFAVQEQIFSIPRSGLTYRPRGERKDRFVEWRVFVVNQETESVPTNLNNWWNKDIACPLIQGLRTAKDGAPLSLAPTLRRSEKKAADLSPPWMAAMDVRDYDSNNAFWDKSKTKQPQWKFSPPIVQPAKTVLPPSEKLNSLSPDFTALLEGVAPFSDTTWPPLVPVQLCHPSELPAISPSKQSWLFSKALFASDVPAVAFGLKAGGADKTRDTQPWFRIGALDLSFDKSLGLASKNNPPAPGEMAKEDETAGSCTSTSSDFDSWSGWKVVVSTRDENTASPKNTGKEPAPVCNVKAPIAHLEMRLPIFAKAGALDRLQQEDLSDVDRELVSLNGFQEQSIEARFEADEPLVIELAPLCPESAKQGDDPAASVVDGRETPTAGEALQLRAREAVSDGRNHNLRLNLFSHGGSAQAPSEQRDIMVLDRTPFAVYLVRARPLAQLATAEAAEIAVWDAGGEGGAHWRLATPASGIEIILPPQGVGEAMEKTKDGHPADPKPGESLDFRFSPHARLSIDPSFEARRYGETPWNVRRLFGYAGQRLPGSWLTGFTVELLYGLTGSAKGLKNLLIAEAESRLGHPPGRQQALLPWRGDQLRTGAGSQTLPVDQQKAWEQYGVKWSQIRAQLFSRLGVLEAYPYGEAQTVIREGLVWTQRRTAHLQFPFPNYEQAKKQRPSIFKQFFDETDGLAGGWTWGFTSLNILEAVLRDPQSTSGFLTGLKFSALGGWGFQKASFDHDRSSVYANTSMGRTHFYSLERIGRIGVLWNRAKHVIVFERSVAPTAQFKKEQDPQLGRPLLRKVAEYVELLQPERAFPDADAPAASRGCVVGINFQSKKIPVNSAWGEDIPGYGWKIPLWNTLDGRQQADVYPRPQIHFVMAADPEADAPTTRVLCNTPELLYFYTDTRPNTGADTDAWEPILNVDFGIAGSRWLGEVGLPGHAGPSMDWPLPPEISVPPGLHQFTFGLDPSERPANLTADRADKALNATLRNVTLMRAVETTEPSKSTDAGTLLNGSAGLHAMARRLEHKLKVLGRQAGTLHELKSQAIDVLKSKIGDDQGALGEIGKSVTVVKDQYDALKRKFPKESGDLCALAITNAEQAFDRWASTVLGAVDQMGTELVQRVQIMEKSVEASLKGYAEAKTADELKKKVDESLVAVTGVLTAIDTAAASLETGLGNASKSVLGVQRNILTGIDTFEAELLGLGDTTKQWLDEARTATQAIITTGNVLPLDRLFAQVADLRVRLRALLQRLNEGVEKLERVIISKGQQLGTIGKKVRLNLNTCRAGVVSGAQAIDQQLLAILAIENTAEASAEKVKAVLNSVSTRLGVIQGDIERELKTVLSDAKCILSNVRGEAEKISEALQTRIRTLAGNITEIRGTVEALQTAIGKAKAKINGKLEEAKKELGWILNDLGRGVYGAEKAAVAIAGARTELVQNLSSTRTSVLTNVRKICDETVSPIVTWLENVNSAAQELFCEIKKDIEEVLDLDTLEQTLQSAANRIVGEATAVYEQAREAVEASPIGPVLQHHDKAIRLIRAFGDPPQLPKLDFNRAATAFLFGNPKDAIDITPVTAWFDQVNADLKALGIRLPTDQLLDRLIPQSLKDFDFGSLLPDIAGLKIDRLFPNLRVPEGMDDAIRVTHGLDKQRQRAWAEAVVDMKLTEKTELFAFGPLTLTLFNTHFDAKARLETGLDGKVERRAHGSITGNWQLEFGGQQLVTFRDTALHFDESGQTKFDLSPDRMEMAAALRYLSDLAKQLQYDKNGFVFRILERNGLPYGAEAFFDIALPPLQYGTTGIIGASFGAGMRLEAYPDFSIGVHMHVSRQTAPFIFSVFILGGAGCIEARARYLPFRNVLTTDVFIKLGASAALAFSFGPICGQVTITIAVLVDYHRQPGQGGGSLNMGLDLTIVGLVDVGGFATIALTMVLRAVYQSNGSITASGSLEIKISFTCFCEVVVSTDVRYDFKTGKKTSETTVKSGTGVSAVGTLANGAIEHPAYKGAMELALVAA